jgi:hypothetical protein
VSISVESEGSKAEPASSSTVRDIQSSSVLGTASSTLGIDRHVLSEAIADGLQSELVPALGSLSTSLDGVGAHLSSELGAMVSRLIETFEKQATAQASRRDCDITELREQVNDLRARLGELGTQVSKVESAIASMRSNPPSYSRLVRSESPEPSSIDSVVDSAQDRYPLPDSIGFSPSSVPVLQRPVQSSSSHNIESYSRSGKAGHSRQDRSLQPRHRTVRREKKGSHSRDSSTRSRSGLFFR